MGMPFRIDFFVGGVAAGTSAHRFRPKPSRQRSMSEAMNAHLAKQAIALASAPV
jgi:hypothetical protein